MCARLQQIAIHLPHGPLMEADDRQSAIDCNRAVTFFATIVLPPERRARADGCSVIRNSDREAR